MRPNRHGFVALPLVLLAGMLLAACGSGDSKGGRAEGPEAPPARAETPPVEAPAVAPDAAPAPGWDEAANATYVGPMAEAIRLEDGSWEGAPYVEGGASAPRAGLARDFLLTGDLDGDGGDETVVLLWTSGGGSGTFDYLVVLGRGPDGAVSERASAPLGDRVKIRSAAVADGAVVIGTVQAGPEDAACCPGQKFRRAFALEGERLNEIATEDHGRLSLADLAGEWRLRAFAGEAPLPGEVTITLALDGDRIAGSSGCNRYTGRVVTGESPGALSPAGPFAGTRMMCPEPHMRWEERYLAALGALVQYSFRAGRLVLVCQRGETRDILEFERAAPGA